MKVENFSDERWVGVKGQSRSVIAGSPRKILRYRLKLMSIGGRALNGLGRLPAYQPQSNSECQYFYLRRQSTGDKVRGREGNIPDHQLRSLNLG